MKSYVFLLCPILSFLSGFALTRYLTCHPLYMSAYLLFTCLLSFAALALLYKFLEKHEMAGFILGTALIFFFSGYFGTLHSFMNISDERVLPKITRVEGEQGQGHAAVILLAHGEPETYDARPWIKQMKELDAQKIPFVPYPFRPFFFSSLRKEYLLAGKSGHNAECLQIMKELENEYRQKGDMSTRFYISYLENEPYPDTAVIKALNEGADSIIICNVFITISNHTQEAIDLIKPIRLENYGVEIKYTKPLYDSKTLQRLYVDKLNSTLAGTKRDNVGVVLVGHGQPEEWDREFPTETRQEISFRQDILKQLEQSGYNPQNMKLAWMEFREPRPKTAVDQLLENGVTDMYYFSTIIGSESIHAKYDIPKLMNKVKMPKNIRLQQLTAFEDKSGIVMALMERIEQLK